jgi:hypothetical protein
VSDSPMNAPLKVLIVASVLVEFNLITHSVEDHVRAYINIYEDRHKSST